jgi:hypothetical protein
MRLMRRMTRFEDKPPILVKDRYSWMPGYLVDFNPVTSQEAHRKGKRDEYVVEAHPATGWSSSKRLRKERVMFLEDESIAECTVSH